MQYTKQELADALYDEPDDDLIVVITLEQAEGFMAIFDYCKAEGSKRELQAAIDNAMGHTA